MSSHVQGAASLPAPDPTRPLYPTLIRAAALAGLFLVSLNLRAAVTSLSAIYGFMAQGIHHLNIGLLGTLPVICFAVFGSLSAGLARRLGLERALILAMVLITLGIGLRSLVSRFDLFALFSFFALVGIAFGNVLVLPAIKKYFPDHIGSVTAMFSVMITVSSGLPSAIAVPVATAFGWRENVGLWAIPALLSILPWLVIALALPGAHAAPAAATRVAPGAAAPGAAAQGRVPNPSRWLPAWSLAVIFGVSMMFMYAILSWLPTYLVSQGVSRGNAGTALFLFSVIGIPHALIIPLIIARLRRPVVLVLIAALMQIAGCAGLFFTPHLCFLWASVAGLGAITINTPLAMINLRSRSNEGSAALSSFMQGAGYVLAAFGPLLFGKLHLATGAWGPSFAMLAVMAVVMLAASAPAMRQRCLEDG